MAAGILEQDLLAVRRLSRGTRQQIVNGRVRVVDDDVEQSAVVGSHRFSDRRIQNIGIVVEVSNQSVSYTHLLLRE